MTRAQESRRKLGGGSQGRRAAASFASGFYSTTRTQRTGPREMARALSAMLPHYLRDLAAARELTGGNAAELVWLIQCAEHLADTIRDATGGEDE